MTNKEIKQHKKHLAEINKYVNQKSQSYETNEEWNLKKERLQKLIQGIIKLQVLADAVCAKKYLGSELERAKEEASSKNIPYTDMTYFNKQVAFYEPVYGELSQNIYYVLHTEEMFNACVYAKWSSLFAAIAAIAACISIIVTCISVVLPTLLN